jgi:hypothetical protein
MVRGFLGAAMRTGDGEGDDDGGGAALDNDGEYCGSTLVTVEEVIDRSLLLATVVVTDVSGTSDEVLKALFTAGAGSPMRSDQAALTVATGRLDVVSAGGPPMNVNC